VAAERDFEARVRDLAADARITRLLMPAVSKLGAGFRRQHAEVRCLIAALAAERYRRAHGRWPESLAQLTPQLLGEVPLDPYDGKPLRFKRLAVGVLVYSVGPDEADDGGVLDPESPGRPGSDTGVRLWDLPQRRQPPRAAPAASR
jgi:hypothetical protein